MQESLEFEKPIKDLEYKLKQLRELTERDESLADQIKSLEDQIDLMYQNIVDHLGPWQRVLIARHSDRPNPMDYIERIMDDFLELHGDRRFGDDASIVAGPAKIEGRQITVVAQHKGRGTQESIRRNFGMNHPEGYRKVLRIMKLSEKFKRPVVCFIDTMGAYPGQGAEERGQAEAIALNLLEMSMLTVPIIVLVTGEGGSGGALGISIGDRIYMQENAVYSVISPEGCAAILWKDRVYASAAAEKLKISAADLYEMGIIHGIIPEPPGGAHREWEDAADMIKEVLLKALDELSDFRKEELLEQRYRHFRNIGEFASVPLS